MTILIVDDNAQMRATIGLVVAERASNIREASSGAEAIGIYERYRPDWVLMDVSMPGMDGLSATQAIVSHDPRARVVIVTDFRDAEFQRAAVRAGAVAFVLKDDLSALLDILPASAPS